MKILSQWAWQSALRVQGYPAYTARHIHTPVACVLPCLFNYLSSKSSIPLVQGLTPACTVTLRIQKSRPSYRLQPLAPPRPWAYLVPPFPRPPAVPHPHHCHVCHSSTLPICKKQAQPHHSGSELSLTLAWHGSGHILSNVISPTSRTMSTLQWSPHPGFRSSHPQCHSISGQVLSCQHTPMCP